MTERKIIIVGGGLAGLTLALHLLKKAQDVLVLEKEEYPRHKVCGEYISNEVLPYWGSLGIDPFKWGAVPINTIQFSNVSGKSLKANLPLGGFGISRYHLDDMLQKMVLAAGGTLLRKQVIWVAYENEGFRLELSSEETLHADLVVGAFGKRSNLDISLSRNFIKKKSPWLAVKAHYRADWDSTVVGLHNFHGGYCGISQVEDDRLNVCYLADLNSFQKYKDLDKYREQVLCQNPNLAAFFKNATPLFEKPLTISQIAFDSKQRVHDHILMCGDSASLIHPLCGNGMGMAVMGAKILAGEILNYLDKNTSREQLENYYDSAWTATFSKRLSAGRRLQRLLGNEWATSIGIDVMKQAPFLFRKLITTTHGKPAAE